jgi:GDP-L-fucose synthase
MTLLLTGSSGFLGKHVTSVLNEQNIFYLSPSSKELDLTNESSVMNYFEINRPNKIIHMAAFVGGIKKNLLNPFDMLYLNTKMVMNIFTAISKHGCDYFGGLGSVCMYDGNCPVPFKEDNMFNGNSDFSNRPYGDSKRLLLSLFQAYKRERKLTGNMLIPVNMYGSHDNFDLDNSHVIPGLINRFLTAIENNESAVYCFGTGEGSREFLNVQDCAEVIVKAMNMNLDYSEPINIGTGKSILIKDLANLIAELTGFKGDILFTGEVGDGQKKRMLDVSRAKAVLDWEAKIDLREGLKRTIKWYKENK